MDPRVITENYHVSPQIAPEDAAAIKAAGYDTVICNRPDEENPAPWQAEAMRTAMTAQGLRFEVLPITHQTLSPQLAASQRALVDAAEGRVLAYCASGTRCTIVWALGEAASGGLGSDEIIAAAAAGGYDLAGLRPTLEALRPQG